MMKWSGVDHAHIVQMLFGPFAIGLGQHVVSLADEDGCRRGLPGRLRLSSMRGSGNRAPWMVTEVFADLFWEGLAFVF